MEDILLIGGGGHCKAVIDVIEQEAKYNIEGIIDTKDNIGKSVLGYKIIGSDDDLEKMRERFSHAFITIGHIRSNTIRVSLFAQLKKLNYTIPTIISPLAYVSKHSTIGDGTVIMHQALVNSNTQIGQNCIINSKALIEHDCTLEDNVHISTSATLNGGTIVKENIFVGSGAVSKEYTTIDEFVKAGSVVK